MQPEASNPFAGSHEPRTVDISWDTGETFHLEVTYRRCPLPSGTLITYFPALLKDTLPTLGTSAPKRQR